MRIARSAYDAMVAHAREARPKECCGMLAAVDGVVVAAYRARNARDSHLAYEIDPHEQLRLSSEIDDAGQEFAAIYHSHPRTEAAPSQTDINLAKLIPDHVIVGLADPDAPEVRAFRIAGGRVTERDVVLED